MGAAAATRQPASTRRSRPAASALLIGCPAAASHLESLFAHSHWELEQETGLAAAVRRLSSESFSAVLCGVDDWQRCAAALHALPKPPLLIALTDQSPGSGEIFAIGPDVYCADLTRTSPRDLFSLLNHAWRMQNEAR